LAKLIERSFRPLVGLLTADERSHAWSEVEKESQGGPITAGLISRTVKKLYSPEPERQPEDDIPTEELVSKLIAKFLARYPKHTWRKIADLLQGCARQWMIDSEEYGDPEEYEHENEAELIAAD